MIKVKATKVSMYLRILKIVECPTWRYLPEDDRLFLLENLYRLHTELTSSGILN